MSTPKQKTCSMNTYMHKPIGYKGTSITRCKSCAYAMLIGQTYTCCEYLLIERERRGNMSAENCDKYITRGSKKGYEIRARAKEELGEELNNDAEEH